jgi:2'-5' RNA ligase
MEPQYYRTFIGLPVKVGGEVIAVRNRLMESLADERISWVVPENFHVTLRFLGETEKEAILPIQEALQRELELPLESSIPLFGPGSFGPSKKPRVIWLGFGQEEPFQSLKAGTDRALETCGWPLSDQPFRAHLTLGRVRSLKDPDRFYKLLEQMRASFAGSVWLDRMVFYRSELGKNGPTYTVLKEIRFAD